MLKEYQGGTLSTSATVTKQLLVTLNCVIQDFDLEQYREREVSKDMTYSVMVLKNSDVCIK